MKKLISFIILLNVIVLIGMGASFYFFEEYQLSAYGSMIAAAGSLLAVILFSANLWNQSMQLNEQRIQFVAEFRSLKESGRRESLMMAKNILDDAEKKAISACGEIASISELASQYMLHVEKTKSLMESRDPGTVMQDFQSWIKIETAANIFLSGIKSAAEMYLKGLDAANIDFSKSPEEFVQIYSPLFQNLPFFNIMQGTAVMLSELMVILKPLRNGVNIAIMADSVKALGKDIMDLDKLKEMIREQKEKGYIIPEIAKDL